VSISSNFLLFQDGVEITRRWKVKSTTARIFGVRVYLRVTVGSWTDGCVGTRRWHVNLLVARPFATDCDEVSTVGYVGFK